MQKLHLIDDGFGNLLEACGSWYHDHPGEPVPPGMIRANYSAALRFVFGHWHQPEPVRLHSVEISPGIWAQRGSV